MKHFFTFLFACALPFSSISQSLDCANMCVTNIVMNAEGGLLDITIINGSSQINYPIVTVIVDGDTVGNIGQQFFIFAHISAQEFTHTVPTTLASVPANFTCVVIIEDSTTGEFCTLNYPCVANNISSAETGSIVLYPNPATDFLRIQTSSTIVRAQIFDLMGRCITPIGVSSGGLMDIGHLPSGHYLMRLEKENDQMISIPFVKE
jgi:hypothetical protein